MLLVSGAVGAQERFHGLPRAHGIHSDRISGQINSARSNAQPKLFFPRLFPFLHFPPKETIICVPLPSSGLLGCRDLFHRLRLQLFQFGWSPGSFPEQKSWLATPCQRIFRPRAPRQEFRAENVLVSTFLAKKGNAVLKLCHSKSKSEVAPQTHPPWLTQS